jgi:hypothetical protein
MPPQITPPRETVSRGLFLRRRLLVSIAGENIDTLILNAKLGEDFPAALAYELDSLKLASQEAEDDLPTPHTFVGETLFIKPHGAGKQWRWILHCPSLHLDVGLGRRNHIVAKARLSAAYLWANDIGDCLAAVFGFLTELFGGEPLLQVSEVHLCVDVAGWTLTMSEAQAFVTRGYRRGLRLEDEDGPEATAPELQVNLNGRRCGTLDFSKGAPHSCCIYDKPAEITVSRKDWMRAVWTANGWDGVAPITRVEFRYKRECLKETGVDEAYAFLDQIPGLWAYSTKKWLRHTLPSGHRNQTRWPTSPVWEAVQQAKFFCDGTPAVRERKTRGDLILLCQMMAGCSSTASALLTAAMPPTDDGSAFLLWFYTWMEAYLQEKGTTFDELREAKRLKLGVIVNASDAA